MQEYSLYSSRWFEGNYQPQVEAYYYKQWNGFRMPHHSHNRVEIMYVISGQCLVETDKDSFAMKKGDLILLDANVPHNLIVEDCAPCRMLNVEFIFADQRGSIPWKMLVSGDQDLSALLAMKRSYWLLRDAGEVYLTLKSLVMELDAKGKVKSSSPSIMIHLLLSQLLIRIAQLAVEEEKNGALQADFYVRQATAYMHQHYDFGIQVKDIAAAVNLHPGYLHRIFKANMACTVMDYLTRLRVDKARMLLARTDIPLLEITEYIGMNSRQYFSSVFKKHTGMTPVQYRKSVAADYWDKLDKVK